MTSRLPLGNEDLGLRRLSYAEMFPPIGAPIHVTRPIHHGDTPLHDHDFLEVALVCAGHAVHRTIHGQQAIGPGDCFVLQPGQWHAYERSRGLSLYNLCFASNLMLRELAWARSDPVLSCFFPAHLSPVTDGKNRRSAAQGVIALHFAKAELSECIAALERLRGIQHQPALVQIRSDAIGHLLLVLGLVARQIIGERKPATKMELSSNSSIATTVQALEEQLEKEWSLDELAELAGLNRSYFVRRFKRATGWSPMAYLARRRAEKSAVLLLTTDLPISQVGRLVGWHDPNYFARRFRQSFAMSAREYREQLPTPPLARTGDDWSQW